MGILFFGTPPFAAEILQYLLSCGVDIRGVVTQPDRPKGRSGALIASPVKEVARKAGISVFQPLKASEEIFLREIQELQADLFVVVAFGQILPQKLLDIPPLGCINVHASLLPKYRGAAPMQRSLMDGVEETGVAIQKMVKQLDAGDVIDEARLKVASSMTFGELQAEMIELSKGLLLKVIGKYREGIPEGKPQDAAEVTFAPKIEAETCQIDWSRPAREIHNLVRALSPKPGAWCWIQLEGEKKRLKILRTQVVEERCVNKDFRFGVVACGVGKGELLELLEVQPEGKKAMTGKDWFRGLKKQPIF